MIFMVRMIIIVSLIVSIIIFNCLIIVSDYNTLTTDCSRLPNYIHQGKFRKV